MQTLCREDFDSGPTCVNEIEPRLWLGNLSAALDLQTLGIHKISHILTVDICPLPQRVINSLNFTVKWIKISDLPYEDLLSHLDETYKFIEDGVREGCVLVHCYYGVSRSAAIVIAFLMKKYSLTYDEAYAKLKGCRKIIGPNYGFERQLRLYEVLKCTIDKTNLQYRMFRLRVTANQVSKVKIVPQSCQDVLRPDPSLSTIKPNPRTYRCKKCRRVVACEDNLLPHVKREKLSWKDDKWSLNHETLDLCRQTYFIEPLVWIESVLTSESGKIHCPKCKTKLGSFNWVMGSQCSCGGRVSPSFYLIPSKVDFSNFVQNVQITV